MADADVPYTPELLARITSVARWNQADALQVLRAFASAGLMVVDSARSRACIDLAVYRSALERCHAAERAARLAGIDTPIAVMEAADIGLGENDNG